MPIKTILVPLNGVASDRSTLELAGAVARASGAHVEGLLVRRDPAEAFAYAGLGADAVGLQQIAEKVARDAAAASAAVEETWRAWRAERALAEADRPRGGDGVTVALSERVGLVRDHVAERGRVVDLIVITSPADARVKLPDLAVEAALFETGRPVLVAPPVPAPTTVPFATAVVAWNGSLEANRAVAAAMPLIAGAAQLFVFCEAERKRGAVDPAPLLDYFGWHGIKADRLAVYQRHGSVGEDLLAAAARVGAGLLVMGAYSHTRLREMVLGGVTQHVLHHAPIPVLLAH